MQITNVVFYLLVFPVFVIEAWFILRWVPFYRGLVLDERRSGRILSIDGLRGILALSVFFLHSAEYQRYKVSGVWLAPRSNLFSQFGIVAVTLFFCITGYVFWSKLSKQPDLPAIPFFYARLARLGGPFVLACCWLFLLTAIASSFHRNVSWVALIVQVVGWLSIFGSGHEINDIAIAKVWLGPVWTLRAEWYFYLSLPLLGWFAHRASRLPWLFGTAALVSFVMGRIHAPGLQRVAVEMVRSYSQFLACLFSVGMVTAIIRPGTTVKTLAKSPFATVASLAFICATLLWVSPRYGIVESLLLAVPFACVCWGNTWFGFLVSSPLLFLGRISYSFYLLHLLVLVTCGMAADRIFNIGHMGPLAYWAFAGTSGAITILISAVSYRFLEHPFLHVRLGSAKPVHRADRAILPPAVTLSS